MLKDKIRFSLKKILKNLKILKKNSPNWKKIISSNKKIYEELKIKSRNGQKILICTSAGGHLLASQFEALMALGLTRYGANVEIMLCDKALKACHMTTSNFIDEDTLLNKGQKKLCNSCLDSGKESFEELGLKINYYSNFISNTEEQKILNQIDKMDFKEMKKFCEDEVPVGEHAYAGILRYYAVGTLDKEKNAKKIFKKFITSALITKKVFFNFFSINKFEKIVLNHAIYVPQGIICDIAKLFKIKIIAYATAYKKNSFIYSYDDTYHRTMMDEDTKDWENIDFDQNKEKILFEYLNSRKYGSQDMFYYFKNPSFEIESQLKGIGVDLSKPIIGILPNIIWDAQLEYKNNIFENMVDWIINTLKYLAHRKDIQVVVRSHPGEVYADRVSKQLVKEVIRETFNEIPKNLKIIDADSDISSYSFANYCNTLIIYATKMGIEFSPFGNRIICAGESYIKNKGITLDPNSKEEYYNLLNKLPNIQKPSVQNIERAKKYAYHYFFRRTFQIESLDSTPQKWPPFKINEMALDKIINNNDNGLKAVCDCIINNKKFIQDI